MPASKRLRRLAVFAMAFVSGLWVCDRFLAQRSRADESAATAPASRPATTRPAFSKDVQALVDRLATAYDKTPLRLEAQIVSEFDVAGMKEGKTIDIRSLVGSRDAYRHEAKGELLIDSDGTTLHLFDIARNQYADATLADDVSKTAGVRDDAKAVLLQQNPAAFIALGNDAGDAVSFEGGDVALLEPAVEEGKTLDRLESKHDAATRQVWIDRDRGTIDRVVYDFSKLIEARGGTEVKRAVVTIRYTATEVGGIEASADAFAFTPPADATPMRSAGQGELMTGDPTALEGKPAPAFELKDQNGNAVKFTGSTGGVVVLDFWATWCPPCRASLPHLAAAAAKYAGQGVKVYAINQGEDATTVKTYLDEQKLDLVALVDSEGEVNAKFGVSGIPQTVVIGPDGIVRKVTVGFDESDTSSLDTAIEAAQK